MNNETTAFWNYWVLSWNEPKPLWQLLRQPSIITGMQIIQIQIKWMKRKRSAHWQCWWYACVVSSHVSCQDDLEAKKKTNLLMVQQTFQWQLSEVLLKWQHRIVKDTGQFISPLLTKWVSTLLEILLHPDNEMHNRKGFVSRKITSCNQHHASS